MSKYININGVKIGLDYEPYFIADIAANHDGDIQRAFKLIELAKESGANAAKFQNFKAEKIVSKYGFENLNGRMSHQKKWNKSVYETYQEASLQDSWTELLKAKCDEVGIEYLTSPYDFENVELADKYVNAFKIGSGDISWHQILKHIATKNKPVLLACGASSMQEVDSAMKVISSVNSEIILMQCNTNYTKELENFKHINLNVLNTFAKSYPNVVLGLSDHMKGHVAVLGAIALGARVIEKHFTDDNSRNGPDHAFSTTPSEWRSMVDDAKMLFLTLGDGVKRVEDNEAETFIVQKRSLYLTADIKKGEVISEDSIIALRPRNDYGFDPWEAHDIIGMSVKSNVRANHLLKREDIYDNGKEN